jgi:hypothetical protein
MNCWELYGNIWGKQNEGDGRWEGDWHVVYNIDETRFQLDILYGWYYTILKIKCILIQK